MMIAEANGISLAYESFGDPSGEPLLLIAGLGSQMVTWPLSFCRALSERGFHVVRFDNRDCGLSTHFSGTPYPDFEALAAGNFGSVPYTLHDMAGDAAGLLDALSIRRAHVVGRSMGGMIGQVLASEYPARVMSLTSIMSSTGNPDLPQAAPDVMALMTSPRPDPTQDREGYISQGLAFARQIAGNCHDFDEAGERALILEQLGRACDPAGTGRQLAAMAIAGDRRDRLSTIQAPTLIVHGAQDPLIPPACGEDTAKSIPGAEFLLLEGMGHDIPHSFHQVIIDAIWSTAKRSAHSPAG